MCLLMIDASAKQWGYPRVGGIFCCGCTGGWLIPSMPAKTAAEWAGNAGCRQWVAFCCLLSSPGLGKSKMTHIAAGYCKNLGY